jgi:predicted transcriptional regulator
MSWQRSIERKDDRYGLTKEGEYIYKGLQEIAQKLKVKKAFSD